MNRELEERYWIAMGKLCDISGEPNGRMNHERDNYKTALGMNRELLAKDTSDDIRARCEAHIAKVTDDVDVLYVEWLALGGKRWRWYSGD